MITVDGLRFLPVKLADAAHNLSTVGNLAGTRRQLKLDETADFIQMAARVDWAAYELLAQHLPAWKIDVPTFETELKAQQEKGVVVCRSRETLDFAMVRNELPIQHPDYPVITVFVDMEQLLRTGEIEVGLPRIASPRATRLRAICERMELGCKNGRSLFAGYFDIGARDKIYVISRIRGIDDSDTVRIYTDFLNELRVLQQDLARGTTSEERRIA